MNRKYDLLKDLAKIKHYFYKYKLVLEEIERLNSSYVEIDVIDSIKYELNNIDLLINIIMEKVNNSIKLEDKGISKKY